MTLGEQGGTIHTLGDAIEVQELTQPQWAELIDRAIGRALVETGFFHTADLVWLNIPAERKKMIGGRVSAVLSRGHMEATTVRKAAVAAESHNRKSAVYRITEKGRAELTRAIVSAKGLDEPDEEAGGDRSGSAPEGAAEAKTGASRKPAEGNCLPSAEPLHLFEEPESTAPGHYRDAAA